MHPLVGMAAPPRKQSNPTIAFASTVPRRGSISKSWICWRSYLFKDSNMVHFHKFPWNQHVFFFLPTVWVLVLLFTYDTWPKSRKNRKAYTLSRFTRAEELRQRNVLVNGQFNLNCLLWDDIKGLLITPKKFNIETRNNHGLKEDTFSKPSCLVSTLYFQGVTTPKTLLDPHPKRT